MHCAVRPEQWAEDGHHATWLPDGKRISMNLDIDRDGMRFVQVNEDGTLPRAAGGSAKERQERTPATWNGGHAPRRRASKRWASQSEVNRSHGEGRRRGRGGSAATASMAASNEAK